MKTEKKIIKKWEHQGWGNCINFTTDECTEIEGWLTPRPNNGDELQVKMKSGKIGRYEIIDIDYMSDPRDMFFANLKPIGYVGEEPIVETNPSKVQRILRWLPHKIDIFLFELFGGLKKK